jgi:serine/threonine-protein kinase
MECDICNAEIQNRLKHFGYKVISEDDAVSLQEERLKLMLTKGFSQEIANVFVKKPSDISVTGMIKLKRSPKIEVAGVEVQTTLLTAWSLEAVDNHASEVIFSENFRPPRGTAYNDEDEAIMEVGRKVGNLFSRDIFKDYVLRPSHDILVTFAGIRERDLAKMMKKELLGLRSVLNVNFREFLSGGETVFEVEFGGSRENFSDVLDGVILEALNRKYGARTFAIQEEHGDVVRITVDGEGAVTRERMEQGVPTQLTGAVAEGRIKEVVKSPELLSRYEELMDL